MTDPKMPEDHRRVLSNSEAMKIAARMHDGELPSYYEKVQFIQRRLYNLLCGESVIHKDLAESYRTAMLRVLEQDHEIAALRAKLAEAEARAAKWTGEEEHSRLLSLGWTCSPVAVWHRGPGMVEAEWHYLMVPPVPLPEPDK